MAQGIRVGFAGAGGPAMRHAEGYRAAGGFQMIAVADLIPSRRQAMMSQFGVSREFVQAEQLAADPEIDLLSLCLPNDLHTPIALAALKAGKHVVCETPPALSSAEAKKLAAAAAKSGKTLLYASQRRFGGGEQAARQAIAKGYIGEAYHVRASWMRTRGIPAGTGWFTDKSRSGGGALQDLGAQMLDLGWYLLGQPEPQAVFGATTNRLLSGDGAAVGGEGVETAAFALIRFAGGKTLELASSWAINQSPRHQGTVCRVHATEGAIDLYTPRGPLLYRKFGPKGDAKETPLKLPKIVLYEAMMRHLKRCIAGAEQPLCGPEEGAAMMQLLEGIYRSAETGKSVGLA